MSRRAIWCSRTSLFAAILLLGISVGAGSAAAIQFDDRGRATLDAAYTQGFEEEPGPDSFRGDAEPSFVGESSLEGDRTLVVGEGEPTLSLALPTSEFEGRRVNVRLWFRARGTDLAARLFWGNRSFGDEGSDSAVSLANVPLHRTGRATTDGWIELETGPIDWEFGEAGGPQALVLTDTQFSRRRPLGRDSSLSVQVDAVEIRDLGEAAVPSADCTLGNEREQCGERGVCMLGECVDSAAAFGSLPRPEVREEYLERRSFLVETTHAIRRARSSIEEFESDLEGLRSANPREAWTQMVESWEMLRDGHARPPSNRVLRARGTGGVCLGPGRADLLEGVSEAPVPMVFDAGDGELREGAVLTSIDGMSVDEWRPKASRYLYYNGDPAGRKALTVNDLLRAAVVSGSTVEFTQCSPPKSELDQPCTSEETTTVTIDYADEVGDRVWNGEGADDYFGGRQICDFSFGQLRPENERVRRGDAFFDESEDGLVRAEFYNMPRTSRRGEGPFEEWSGEWANAMSGEPDKVLVDQRLGFGGSFTATHFLGSLFLDASREINEVGLPWFGVELSEEMVRGLRQCAENSRGRRECSGVFSNEIQDRVPTDLGANSKVALLSARSVSGHDFYAKYMTFREAETRLFGYSPTIGGFGELRRFAPLPGEIQAPNHQFHDSRFYDGEGNLVGASYTSGRGVGPDEVVYQKQSDALVDVDTVVEAAEEWLRRSE